MGDNIFGEWEPELLPRRRLLIRFFLEMKELFWDGETVVSRILFIILGLMLSSLAATLIYFLILLITGQIK